MWREERKQDHPSESTWQRVLEQCNVSAASTILLPERVFTLQVGSLVLWWGFFVVHHALHDSMNWI